MLPVTGRGGGWGWGGGWREGGEAARQAMNQPLYPAFPDIMQTMDGTQVCTKSKAGGEASEVRAVSRLYYIYTDACVTLPPHPPSFVNLSAAAAAPDRLSVLCRPSPVCLSATELERCCPSTIPPYPFTASSVAPFLSRNCGVRRSPCGGITTSPWQPS